ncbi:hypothetical protein [uncultured Jatrophihabitans sp.]|uniref:hypothetical protein n=1 Tax=uncultured Jatrophihabitans sp. TaxID=1610747 RepID=UPI0035CA6BFA
MTAVRRTAAEPVVRLPSDAVPTPQEIGFANAQWAVAVLASFLVGLHFVVHGGVDLSAGLAVVLAAIWLKNLARFSGAWLLIVTGVIAIVWGWFLGDVAVADGYFLSSSDRVQTAAEFGSVLVGVGLLLWVRTVVSMPVLGTAFGLGLVINAQLFGEHSADLRKYTWGLPLSVLAISLAMFAKRRWVVCVVVVVLAIVAVGFSDRSYSAALLLTLLLYLACSRRARSTAEIPTGLVAAFIVAVAGAIFWLGQTLLVAGFLGKHAQLRTIDQIRASGSLLLGGRPEMAATFALMRHRPVGYGVGVIPQGKDVLVALGELRKASPNIDNDYVTTYLFGGRIELHSVVGDLWAAFGLPGLLFALLIAVLTLRGIAVFVSRRTGTPLALLAGVWTMWNVGFSPFLSSMTAMTLGLALVLPPRFAVPAAKPSAEDDAVTP